MAVDRYTVCLGADMVMSHTFHMHQGIPIQGRDCHRMISHQRNIEIGVAPREIRSIDRSVQAGTDTLHDGRGIDRGDTIPT